MELMKTCCDCSHFRMWKPIKQFCTIKKVEVEPFSNCENYKLRRGLNGIKRNTD
jgi:hypothetical protein